LSYNCATSFAPGCITVHRAYYEYDCNFTASNTTMNCPEGNFTSTATTAAGNVAFCTEKPQSIAANVYGSLACPQTHIVTITDATHVVLNDAPTETCTTPSGSNVSCTFIWSAADDATALQTAVNAAWINAGNTCYPIHADFGGAIVVSAPWAITSGTISASCSFNTDSNQLGPEFYGNGWLTTIIPLPSMIANLATVCTNAGVNGAGGCFSANGWLAHDFQVDGMGQPGSGTAAVDIVAVVSGTGCSGGSAWNININQVAVQTVSSVGEADATCGGTIHNILVENGGAGETQHSGSSSFSTNWANADQITGFGGIQFDSEILGGGTWIETNGTYGALIEPILNNSNLLFEVGGGSVLKWTCTGCKISQEFNGNGFNILDLSGGTVIKDFIGDVIQSPTVNPSTFITMQMQASGGNSINNFTDTCVIGGGSNTQTLNLASGNAAVDLGGNTNCAGGPWPTGGTPNTLTGGYFGSASVTGTAAAASNITASTGWGTSGAAGNGISAVSGATQNIQFTVTAAGTPGANPTLAIVFPTAFPFVAPQCRAIQIGGNGAIADLTTTTGPSTTGVTYTWNATPVAAKTYIIQSSCSNN